MFAQEMTGGYMLVFGKIGSYQNYYCCSKKKLLLDDTGLLAAPCDIFIFNLQQYNLHTTTDY